VSCSFLLEGRFKLQITESQKKRENNSLSRNERNSMASTTRSFDSSARRNANNSETRSTNNGTINSITVNQDTIVLVNNGASLDPPILQRSSRINLPWDIPPIFESSSTIELTDKETIPLDSFEKLHYLHFWNDEAVNLQGDIQAVNLPPPLDNGVANLQEDLQAVNLLPPLDNGVANLQEDLQAVNLPPPLDNGVANLQGSLQRTNSLPPWEWVLSLDPIERENYLSQFSAWETFGQGNN